MMLMYILFALTISAVLTALISAHIQQNRRSEAFIGFFVALMMLSWAADEWLVPVIAAGQKISWMPIVLLIIFGGVFVASTILSIRTSRPLQQTVMNHDFRLDAEAMTFDLILWFALLTLGITVLRSIGL